MPLSVKVFFALALLLAVWWTYFHLDVWMFLLAEAVPASRDAMRQSMYWNLFFFTFVPCVVTIALATAAAFWRQNWARWALLLLLIAGELAQDAMNVLHPRAYTPSTSISDYLGEYWLVPWRIGPLIVEILLLALIFSPNARPWFRKGVES